MQRHSHDSRAGGLPGWRKQFSHKWLPLAHELWAIDRGINHKVFVAIRTSLGNNMVIQAKLCHGLSQTNSLILRKSRIWGEQQQTIKALLKYEGARLQCR